MIRSHAQEGGKAALVMLAQVRVGWPPCLTEVGLCPLLRGGTPRSITAATKNTFVIVQCNVVFSQVNTFGLRH